MKNSTLSKGIIALGIGMSLCYNNVSAQCQFPNPIPFYSQNFGSGARPATSPLSEYQVPELGYVGTGNMNPEKIYTITPTSNLHDPAADWHIINDHTGNPNGRMMLVNDREPAGITYRDRLHSSVLGQANLYYFNAWVMNILVPGRCTDNGNNPDIFISLRVDYKVGGVWTNLVTSPIFTYPSPATSPDWKNIGVNFTTPAFVYDSIRFSVNNESVVLCGNDYVVDDISIVGCNGNIPLPVKLMSFSGSIRNDITTLNWETAGEVNFSHYEIQRKGNNGGNFETIGTVPLQNSSGRANYQYGDNLTSVSGDAFFYRLKMVDVDGKFQYSKEVLVRKSQKSMNGIVVTPSPIRGGSAANIRFEASRNSIVTIRIVDMTGKTVLQQQNKVTEGINSVFVNNTDRLQPGTYVIQLFDGEEITSSKFSVIR
jgi:hypothetical protein